MFLPSESVIKSKLSTNNKTNNKNDNNNNKRDNNRDDFEFYRPKNNKKSTK
jgi:hypothetical protein